jgi:putative spermidine/putrescine transport system ATP-binding protein
MQPAPSRRRTRLLLAVRRRTPGCAGDFAAVDAVDLDVAQGEFFTLLGPSGSGKTTTLRLIAGFAIPDAGTVELRGRDVTPLPPYARDVNTVFQDYALFPHMSIGENVGYGLRIAKISGDERRRRMTEALELVRLTGYSSRAASASASRSPAPS